MHDEVSLPCLRLFTHEMPLCAMKECKNRSGKVNMRFFSFPKKKNFVKSGYRHVGGE